MNSSQRIYQIVKQIPKGKVSTYSQIAKLAGIKNPRLVGSVLHKNPDPIHIPCHRVVNMQGKLAKAFAFGGAKGQRDRLQKEGVEVEKGVINLLRFRWNPETE